MNIIDENEIPFQRTLTDIVSGIIRKYTKGKDKERMWSKEPYPYTLKEQYVADTFLALSEVESVFKQLEQSEYFIANYRQTKKLSEQGINRFQHIIYHIEAHIFRQTGLMDRLLFLLNIVYELKLSPVKCKRFMFFANKKGKAAKFEKLIRNDNAKLFEWIELLNSSIDLNREIRNEIAHQSRYSSEKLRDVELFFIVDEEGVSELPNGSLKYIKKKYADDAVKKFQLAMNTMNLEIRSNLRHIYSFMEFTCTTKYEK